MLRKLLFSAGAAALLLTGSALAQTPRGPGAGGPPSTDELFERLDANGDGALTPDELGERGQRLLQRAGKDRVTREDVDAARAQRQERAGRGRAQLGRQGQGRGPRGLAQGGQGAGRQDRAQRGQGRGARGVAPERGGGGFGPRWQARPGQGGRGRAQPPGVERFRQEHPQAFERLMRLRNEHPAVFRWLMQERVQERVQQRLEPRRERAGPRFDPRRERQPVQRGARRFRA